MKILLSTFLLFITSCVGPQGYDQQVEANSVPAGFTSRVQVGISTVAADVFLPFQYERGAEGVRLGHPVLSIEYNPEQGLLVMGDFPSGDDGEMEKVALLVRKEHIATLNDPATVTFIQQLNEEYTQYWNEGKYVDPSKLGFDYGMRIVDGINQDGYSPSACLYQLVMSLTKLGDQCEACGSGEACADCQQASFQLESYTNLWNIHEYPNFSTRVTLTLPKAEGDMVTFTVGEEVHSKSQDGMNLTESSFSFNETEEGWVYNIFLTPMIVKYLDKVLPASIETRREVLAGGQPFLRESWFVIGLPTVSSFQDHSTAFVIEAIAFVDEVIASARSAGHLTATVEAKIADSNYHANANKAITEGMEELVEELSDNPAALMLAGTDFRFGFAASSPAMVDFAPNHFNFEIPTDRQVIEVVTMFDMFARMGLTQMQGEWEEEEAF